MKRFDQVFPKEYKSPSYSTQRISQLEELFKIESEKPEKRFFHLCLIMDGLRLRFYNADEFYMGKAHKVYQGLLERQRDLKGRKPASGVAPIREWEEETEDVELRIAGFEEQKKKILDQIRAELEVDAAFELPRSLAEYLGLKRLKYHDGGPVPKGKALALQKIAAGMEVWPYLYYSLPRHMSMFDQTDKLANIPKVVEVDALDRAKETEELVEDDAYIEDLAQFMTGNDTRGIKAYVEGHREARIKEREAAKEKAKRARRLKGKVHDNVISAVFDVLAGGTVLISHENWNRIREDQKTVGALSAIFKKYAKKRSDPKMTGGYEDMVTVSDEVLPDLVQEINVLVTKRLKELEGTRASVASDNLT